MRSALVVLTLLYLASLQGCMRESYDRNWKEPAPAEPAKPATPSAGAL